MPLTFEELPRWLRAGFRLPNRLYEHGVGRLLGHRFLQLTHVGRRTGLERHVVLEVVRYDRATGEAVVVSGFGPRADWFRNITATGQASVGFGHGSHPAAFRVLGTDEAMDVVSGYERRNRLATPLLRSVLGRLVGWPYDGSASARRRLVDQLPLVAFRPAR